MPRPSNASLDIRWRHSDPCPCGSLRLYCDCCLASDGLPRCKLASLNPPGAHSGYAHPQCYMGGTENCGQTLSHEHYISRAILDLLEGKTLSGVPWLAPGENQQLETASLTSRILCERHNNALSPLDSAAHRTFTQMQAAFAYATQRSLHKHPRFFLIDGDAFEKWSVKTALGLYHARIAAEPRGRIRDLYQLDADAARSLLADSPLPAPLGIYAHMEKPGPVKNGRIAFAPLVSETLARFCAMSAHLVGASFHILFDRSITPEDHFETGGYRPWAIDYVGVQRTARIIVSWTENRLRHKMVSYHFTKAST